MMNDVTCVLVDDHEVVRAGTAARLSVLGWVTIVGEAETAEEGIELVRRERPHILLLDMRLPGMSGIEALHQLANDADLAATRIIMHSGTATVDQAMRALEAGAVGFVLKGSPLATVVDAMQAAVAGRRYVDPSIAADLLDQSGRPRLSQRELEVLQLVADGMQNPTIAHELSISAETVKAHVSSIISKTGALSRTDAVARGIREGFIL